MHQVNPNRMFLSSPHMGGAERALVEEVFASNWIAPTGPMVTRFEEDLARLTGTGHVAALSSGTAALHLALRLSDVGPGDEVWGATMTFIGGVAPILYLGAKPVFLDVDPDDFLLDLDLLETQLKTARERGTLPKALITTDIYGHVIDGSRVAALRREYGFVWISDTAEAVGSYRDGQHAGKGADFIILSFNGNKIITTSGGGALASDNAEAIDRARFLSTQARDPAAHYEHTTYGYNYRLSNVCAAIGVGQLQVLVQRVARRRRIHSLYRERLGALPGFGFSGEAPGMQANRWLTTVRIGPQTRGLDSEAIRLALEADNIESRPLWKPMHLQPVFADASYFGGDVAAQAFAEGLCLPSGSSMSDNDVDRVCSIIEALARSR
ncbi:DegT/DnrJ/EryC1/StrS family aminotransferase [Sphingomonas phyllosphaerae]|uniref:DegT/DnrJ/EryC1/StrS family aminotransferase n=1 Tax=Sphingomonas phyllosphaerae TaxID=257003 RepID=UPI00048A8670|nr:aminotransferase class I/II-fold pyridoxal phosphate-dependent enzyme [Sphingomonas phyllosphaerae]